MNDPITYHKFLIVHSSFHVLTSFVHCFCSGQASAQEVTLSTKVILRVRLQDPFLEYGERSRRKKQISGCCQSGLIKKIIFFSSSASCFVILKINKIYFPDICDSVFIFLFYALETQNKPNVFFLFLHQRDGRSRPERKIMSYAYIM